MATGRLVAHLDWDAIVDLAGSLYLNRGMRYLEDGRVGPIRATDDAIEAMVHGKHAYEVRVSLDGSRIVSDCTCPIGETGAFCKHCVALSLAWLQPPAGGLDAAPRAKARRRAAAGEDAGPGDGAAGRGQLEEHADPPARAAPQPPLDDRAGLSAIDLSFGKE